MTEERCDIAMVVRNHFVSDTRVEKQAAFLSERGRKVTVFALARADLPQREERRGFRVVRVEPPFPPDPNGDKGRAPLFEYPTTGRPSFPVQAYFYARAVPGFTRYAIRRAGYHAYTRQALLAAQPRVVHCHDCNTLMAGWAAAKQLGAKLVYDSHELWRNRNLPRPERWHQRLKEDTTEKNLIGRADRVITVSETIAEVLAERYGISKPTVLLNVPEQVRPENPKDLRSRVQHDGPLLLYLGRIVYGRGLEQAIRALPQLPDAGLVAMGTQAGSFGEEMANLAETLGVRSRLFFLPPVPPEDVIDWTQSADVGLCTIEPRCMSYELCLPNKLFQCAFAGIPMVATALPEMSRWFERHPLGATCRPHDPGDFARAVSDVLEGRAPQMSEAQRETFRAAWSWESESQKLARIYEGLL